MQSSAIPVLTVVAVLALYSPAQAQLTTWRPLAGDWFTAANWTLGLPDNSNISVVTTGHPTIGPGKKADSWQLWVGARKTQSAECTMKGDKHWVVDFRLGTAKDSTGRYNFDAGYVESVTEQLGIEGSGLIVQKGGTNGKVATPIGWIELGVGTTGQGEYRLEDGEVHAEIVRVGMKHIGAITQTGGKFMVYSTLGLIVGVDKNSTGSYSISGGQLTVHKKIDVGRAGKGTLTQTGGSVVILSDLDLATDPFTGDGTVVVSDGVMVVEGSVHVPGSAGFGGGSGVFKVDGQNADVTIEGTLKVSAGGKIKCPNKGVIKCDTVQGTANRFEGTGKFVPFQANKVTFIAALSEIVPGDDGNAIGRLTIAGDATIASALLAVELGGTAAGETHDQLAITGDATISGGVLAVTLADGFQPELGDTFWIVDAPFVEGEFDVENLPPLADPGLAWGDVHYGAGGVSLEVVSAGGGPCPPCGGLGAVACEAADLTGDGLVDGVDLAWLLAWFGTPAPWADLSGDGIVDCTDVCLMTNAMATCP